MFCLDGSQSRLKIFQDVLDTDVFVVVTLHTPSPIRWRRITIDVSVKAA